MEEFEPKRKIKILTKEFISKNIYVLVLAVLLLGGITYGYTFFIQNRKVASGSITTAALTINFSDRNISASSLSVPTDNQEGLSEYVKPLTITNQTATDGIVKLTLTRTSGLALTDMSYALIVNGAIQVIDDVPSDGVIFETAIMGNETINVEVRLWPKTSYSGSTTTFVGEITPKIRYLGTVASSLTNLTGKYVNFNCSTTCEVWQIVKVEDGRLVLTRQADYTNATSRTNSNRYNPSSFNPAITFNDDSLIASLSTDGKNVYLAKTVKITGGSGTQADPYILSNDIFNEEDKKVLAVIAYKDGTTTLGTQNVYYNETNYISRNMSDPTFLYWDDGTNHYNYGDTITTITTDTNLTAYKVVNAVNLAFDNTITGFNCTDAQCALETLNNLVDPPTGSKLVLRSIEAKQNAATNSCNPVWIDDMGTANDETDDITYFSGTETCVDMNYIWYSGKLWRITAIYPDGAMKLVTEDMITSILWSSDVEYDGSWVYQWLNEDFYDTLVNPSNIVDSNRTWNYSKDSNTTLVRPETIASQKTKVASVGLLNAYEYYNSYRCINSATCEGSTYSTGYLKKGYYWWLITPYSTSRVRLVNHNGILNDTSPSSYAEGVRPSIVIKSGLEFTGSGTKTSPYKIKGDKEDVVNNITLLSSRSIGEYVKFDNDLYRIVDTTNGITKLTRVDYLRNSGTVVTKYLASSVYYGRSSNTQSDDYWDYYLNNTWYNGISTIYKNMLVDGTYFLGLYPNNMNYKATVCKDANLDSVTTANCTKYTSSDTDKTFTGKIGLPRAGEMFSSQLGSGYSSSSYIWLITPYSTSNVRNVDSYGILNNNSPSSTYVVRPSINLKSGIKITGGTGYVGGETNSPFEISE